MHVDTPAGGQVLGTVSTIAGWALDLGAAGTGSGVDSVHVWAYPASGAAPIFLGTAVYGQDRPDVAAVYGARFRYSGFSLTSPPLPRGGYAFVAFARSAVSGQFTNAVPVGVSVN
jgi:hypothetical protein